MKKEDLENCVPFCPECGWKGSKYDVVIYPDSNEYGCPVCGKKSIMWQGNITLEQLFEEMKNHFTRKDK